MSDYSKERQVAIDAVLRASKLCDQVFRTLIQANDAITKKDKSPVTLADFGAQAIVNLILKNSFPEDSIVGEEESSFLRSEEGQGLSDRIVELVNHVADQPATRDQVLDAIDFGNYEGGATGRFWTLDPVDGTKGFLRGGQYAVCLALIVDGEVQLGVMGGPNLSVDFTDLASPKGTLFIAEKGKGAYQRSFQDPSEHPIKMRLISDLAQAKFCESVEAGHSSHDDSKNIAKELGLQGESVRMDSQCKYASISRGDGDIYLRLPVSASYQEKIWDHASGVLLVGEAGGTVTDVHGNKIDFSQGRTLKLNKGIIASHASHHAKVLASVQKVLNL